MQQIPFANRYRASVIDIDSADFAVGSEQSPKDSVILENLIYANVVIISASSVVRHYVPAVLHREIDCVDVARLYVVPVNLCPAADSVFESLVFDGINFDICFVVIGLFLSSLNVFSDCFYFGLNKGKTERDTDFRGKTKNPPA